MQNLEQQLQLALNECIRLKEENKYLKDLLKYHNINPDLDISLQNNNIEITKNQKIQERINIFKNLFKGRTDVFAVRWESRNGKAGYTPACANEWHSTLCKKPAIKCMNCQHRKLLALTDQVIYDHLSGKNTIGIYPLLQDETSWFLAVDFDKKNWKLDVQAFMDTCKEFNVPASVERSRSGNGCHVWIFFNEAIPASLARKLGNMLLSKTIAKRFDVGMDSYDRLFPNQDTLPNGGFGNLIALPLQGGPRKNGNSVFVDENFLPYHDQWLYLKHLTKMTRQNVNAILKTQYEHVDIIPLRETSGQTLLDNNKIVLPNELIILEKNGLYIKKDSLPPFFMQKLILLATFKNPQFYKAQAKRLSTHNIPRNINCWDDTQDFLILPRGCTEDLINLLNHYSIDYSFENQTNAGMKIDTHFKGNLRLDQEQVVKKLKGNSNGILSATTGFGKTIVAAAMIAERKVNTLIIVHRNQLIEQWKKSLALFLSIDETEIGQIGGGKNKSTGIIDIATIQSLNYKGTIKEQVTQYGQIIVDECHHISAFTFEQVLKKANSKYLLGLTATPTRKDGLQPIMEMQLGPIRYKITAKDQAKVRPYEHILVPRYTNFKSSIKNEEKRIQALYKELIDDSNRNQMIFDDVLNELDKGAMPLILTERVEHAFYLESKFKKFAKNIVVLTGKLSKKEEKEQLKRLENLADDEERLIIATGKYIGEGFDHARLDTLFLVMPLSWKGTLQQYVGRLHRLHNDKTKVKVFDYIDKKEPMLNAMFDKRLIGYKSMGYNIIEGSLSSQIKPEQIKLF